MTYILDVPAAAKGTAEFSGIVSVNGTSKQIAGDRVVIDALQHHPADNSPADFRMTVNEVTAYASAWKLATGNIAISYVTRAGFLWKSGEIYKFDSRFEPPNCWTPLSNNITLAADLAASEAVRILPPAFTAGRPVSVTLRINPASGVQNYAVEEQPPAGWIISSNDGAAVRGGIRFGPFYDTQPRSLSYTVIPPTNSLRGEFRGSASFDGSRQLIAGRSAIGHSYGVAEREVNRHVRLRFNATPGERFEVETAGSLDAESWTVVGSIVGAEVAVDFEAIEASESARFYRLRPSP